MTLVITDTILDEEFRNPSTNTADENDVTSAAYAASSFATALGALSLPFLNGHLDFPQFAEKTSAISSSNQVTDYFLSGAGGASIDGTATDLFVSGQQVSLYSTTDPNIVVGRVGGSSGSVALVVGLEESSTGGVVTSADIWIGLYAPLTHEGLNLVDSADELNLSDLIFLGSDYSTQSTVTFSDFSKVPSGNPDFNVIFPTASSSDLQLLVTGVKGEVKQTVNISTNGIGAGSQSTTVGTSIRIDTVSGFIPTNVDANNELVPSAIDYTKHVDVTDASFQITQTNPNHKLVDVNVGAYQVSGDAQEAAFLSDALAADGASVVIDAEDVKILNAQNENVTSTFGGSITANSNGTVTVTNLAVGYQVYVATDGVSFDRLLVTNVDEKDTFDIGNIKVSVTTGGKNTEFAELGSHLQFQDDGPVISLTNTTPATLLVTDADLSANDSDNFSSLFTIDYGADGAGSHDYRLSVKSANVASGLFDTQSGQSIVLSYDAATNTVYGKTVTDGSVVFAITVDSDGQVTFDQQRAIKHGDLSSSNETSTLSAADLITLTASATDGEATGDTAISAPVGIGQAFVFTDDGPSISPEPVGNGLQVDNVKGATDTDAFVLDPGGDGLASFSFINPDSNGPLTWKYADVNGDNIDGTNEILGQYNGIDLYTLVLDSNGSYTVNVIGELPSTPLSLSTAEIKAGAPDSNSIAVGAAGDGPLGDSVITIKGGGGNINESNAFVGVSNGNLDVGESLTFTWDAANGDDLTFEGISIGTKSASSSVYNFSAVQADGGGTITGTLSVGKNGTLLLDGKNLHGETISSVTITKVSGSATKIGIGDIKILIPADDVSQDFTVRLTDGDGDHLDSSFNLAIDGDHNGSYDAVSGLEAASVSSLGQWMLSPTHHWDYFLA